MRWAAVGLLALVAPLAAQDDLVNERPPADRAALERHWGVDCAAAVDRLRQVAMAPGRPDEEIDPIEDTLGRCALLDRREEDGHGRYQRLLDLLRDWRVAADAGRREDCKAVRRRLLRALE